MPFVLFSGLVPPVVSERVIRGVSVNAGSHTILWPPMGPIFLVSICFFVSGLVLGLIRFVFVSGLVLGLMPFVLFSGLMPPVVLPRVGIYPVFCTTAMC